MTGSAVLAPPQLPQEERRVEDEERRQHDQRQRHEDQVAM